MRIFAWVKDQVAATADGLRAVVQRFDVLTFSHESGLGMLVDPLQRHSEKLSVSAEESEILFSV